MSASTPPSAGRRRLRTILRREREAASMTQDQVAIAMDWSLSKVIRIETGTVNISTNDLRALLDLYDVSPPDVRGDLIDLARAARQPPWWAEYKDSMSPAFAYYVGLEPNAAELRFFNNTLMPGLIQTEEYARAAITGALPEPLPEHIVNTRLTVRMRRQAEVLHQQNPPSILVVLDEATIRRQVGGKEVLSRQLAHLIHLAGRQHVRIQVIPFASGTHTGTFAPYIIMDFPDPESEKPVLYSEGAFDDALIREGTDVIDGYRKSFERLAAEALSPTDSVAFIKAAIDDLVH